MGKKKKQAEPPKQEPRVVMIFPKPEVFQEDGKGQIEDVVIPSRAVMTPNRVFAYERAEYPESGGILKYYHKCLYPEKCIPFPMAIHAANFGKRELLGNLRIFSKFPLLVAYAAINKKFLNETLKKYNTSCDMVLAPFYMRKEYPRYYSPASKEMKHFIDTFFSVLGVEEAQIEGFSRIFMTLIDNDNAYRYRIQDLAGVTTKWALWENFPSEMKKVLEEYAKREPGSAGFDGTDGFNYAKVNAIAKIARFAWYLPKFRKAVKEGIAAVDWSKLVMDAGDRYHTLLWIDYNYQGLPFEVRKRMFENLHGNDPRQYPPMIEYNNNSVLGHKNAD